jgi:hypothetical protein
LLERHTDLEGGDRWPPFSLTNADGDHPIDHGRSGDAARGQPTRCSAIGDAGLETVRAKPCWRWCGLRTMTSGEPWAIVRTPGGNRDVPSSRLLAVFLRGSEPPKGRTFVSSARTRMILRTAQKATGNSITRDQIMTGSGRGLDAAESVGEAGGWAVLEGVNCREVFRIGRGTNSLASALAARGKRRVRQFAHANRTLKRGCRDG